jgi:MFS family permease
MRGPLATARRVHRRLDTQPRGLYGRKRLHDGRGACAERRTGVGAVNRDESLLRARFLLAGGVVFVMSLAAFFRAPLLPDIGDDLRLSAGELSLITVSFALGRLFVDVPAGRVADRFPTTLVFAAAGIALCVGSVGLALSQSLSHALAAAAMLGVASAVTNTTGMTEFSSRAPDRRRGRAMATFSMSLLSGQTFGPAVGGALATLGTWRTAQFGGALIGIAVASVCVAVQRSGVLRRADDRAGPGGEGSVPVRLPLAWAERAVLAAIPFSVFFTLAALPQTLVPIIGARELGLPASVIGVVLGAGGASRFLGAAITGTISDRRSRKAALVPGLTVMAVGVGVLAIKPTMATWAAGVVLMSIGSTGVSVTATILGDRTDGIGVGRRLSTFRFAGDLGLLAGPAISGWLYQNTGRAPAVIVVAALLLSCALAATTLKESHPGRVGADDRMLQM